MLVGYQQADSRFVASRVFPAVSVDKDSGTYYIYTKKYWFLDEMKRRAPGAQYARAGVGVETSTYTTEQWALAYPIPDEIRANSQIPLDLESVATRWLGQQSLIRKERQWAADFMKTSVWGTDGSITNKWSDYSLSDPVADVLNAKRAISQSTGMAPNTMVIGEIVYDRLSNHPDLIDRVKYTTAAGLQSVTNALGAIFGGLNVLVGTAIYNSANEAQTASYSALMDDDALILYVAPSPSLFEASAGYTFAWAPGGGTGIIMRNRDDLNDTDIVKIKEQWDQKAVATDAGYFYADCVD
jgi:hypothetical protein